MKQLNTLDRVIAGAAAVAFITLFLPWYGVTIGEISVSGSGGFAGSAGALLLTAAGVLVVFRRTGGALLSGANAGPSAVVAGLAALGLLLVIIRWVTLPGYHASGVNFSYSVGPSYGLYLALAAGIVETGAALLALRAAGEQRPWNEPAPEPEEQRRPET
jgi:hypothetical protein